MGLKTQFAFPQPTARYDSMTLLEAKFARQKLMLGKAKYTLGLRINPYISRLDTSPK